MNNYDILGVAPGATLDEIKRAYRRKTMKCHPDRGGSDELFKQVKEAYKNLTDIIQNLSTGDEYEWFADSDDDIFSDNYQVLNQDLLIKVHIPLEYSYNTSVVEARYELLSGKFQVIDLDVPLGIKSNQQIQYPGFGDDSIPLVPRGNLIVTYVVDQHDKFIRRNDDLCIAVDITALEAMIGTTKIITGLDGEEYEITIPAGTQPNHEIVFEDYGFYNSKKNRRGKFIVIANVIIPTIRDKNLVATLIKIQHLL